MVRIISFFVIILILSSCTSAQKSEQKSEQNSSGSSEVKDEQVSQKTDQKIVQWRGPNRDGIYSETNLLKQWPEAGPQLLWHFDELGEGHSSAAVTDNQIFTAGVLQNKGFVFAFNLDGKLLWKSSYGDEWTENWPGVRTTPLIIDDKLYIMSGFGRIVCMGTDKGNILWTVDVMKDYDGRNITWGVTENLAFDGDKLFCTVGGVEANVIAIDRNTGENIWKCRGKGEKSAYCSPQIIKLANRHILVTMTESSILGIDAVTGMMLWKHEQTNQWSVHANTPLYKDGYLYCVSGYGKGGVMLKLLEDGSKVEEVWRDASLDNRMGGIVLIDDKIYGSGDNNKKWFCLDWKTGKELYSDKLTSVGNIISADGMIYCYGESGEVVLSAADANGFKKAGSFKVPFGTAQHWAHLVINKGKLFVRHGNSLMAYSINK